MINISLAVVGGRIIVIVIIINIIIFVPGSGWRWEDEVQQERGQSACLPAEPQVHHNYLFHL